MRGLGPFPESLKPTDLQTYTLKRCSEESTGWRRDPMACASLRLEELYEEQGCRSSALTLGIVSTPRITVAMAIGHRKHRVREGLPGERH